MLKKLSIRKISLASAALFAILLIYLLPSNKEKLDIKTELEYIDTSAVNTSIFLLDKNSYVALTEVPLSSNQIEAKAKELISILTIGDSDSKIPSGFNAIIPPDTRVLSLEYNDNLIKIDFSKELLDIDINLEEKMIEAIVFTLTSIEGVDKIIIYVEGDILTKLPKTKINLPSTLDRSLGINKEYEFNSLENLTDVTVYYVNQINHNYYYVPVTKYLNDDREKISIIIDELAVGFNHNERLMSFLNTDVRLVSSNIKDKTINLEFNAFIFDDVTTKEVLEEVIYTICLSARENYDVEEVVMMVDSKEIYKTNLKSIEPKGKV